jgi:hypothetical protein
MEAVAMQENGSGAQGIDRWWADYLDTTGLSVCSITSELDNI